MNILKKILSPSCLIISVFLLLYTFYKSEIVWNGEESDYYLIYYIVSTILIIFSIFTFFLNQKIKEYLIISLISIVVGLYIFEGYLTFYNYNYNYKIHLYEKETGRKYDTRTKVEIYEDIKKINNKVKLSIAPSHYLLSIRYSKENYKIFPLSGISNSKTILCNENGYFSIYESDRYGFNNPDKEWDQKEIEYLLVGDSFSQGYCVNRPNNIASVLRTLSNKTVLNLGYGGNSLLIEYATLREYLNSNVKKVLWIYSEGTDLIGLVEELKIKILKNYLDDLTFTQNLKIKQKEIDDLANKMLEKDYNEMVRVKNNFTIKLTEFIKIFNTRQLFKVIPQPEPQPQPEFKKILELIKDLTYQNNSKLYFIYLPEYTRYKKNYNFSYQSIKKIVNELDIPFIDIHSEVFENEQNPLKLFPFELPGHYTVEGYRKIAETVYQFTKD